MSYSQEVIMDSADGIQQTPSENIQVYLRMRPLNQREINEEQAVTAWRIIDQQSITLDQALFNGSSGGRYIVPAGAYASLLAPTSGGSQAKAYTFNGCFNHWENNQEVYERSSVRNIVLSSLEGINGTVFMYGQTGAGKTYTMLGNGMINGVKTRQSPLEQSEMSPRSARLYGGSNATLAQLRRSVSSARNHYQPVPSTIEADQIQNLKRQGVTSLSRQQSIGQAIAITPRQQTSSLIPPLPPMLQGKNKGGRNEQRASILNANTLDPYLDHPLQDFESLENSPQANQEPLSTQDLNTDGILIMALKELFQKIKDPESEKQRVFIIRCSYFEIYNDAVYDLLNIQKELAFAEPLQLNEDIKKKEFIVRGLKEYVVESYEDCLKLLKLGEYHRHYAETRMNHQSSRSHTLFRLHVESVATTIPESDGASGTNIIRESVLNFVDLAGSEKVSNHFSGGGADFQSIYGSQASSFISPKGSLTRKSGGMQDYSTGNGSSASMRVKEGQHINKSLFFLTQVIALKAEAKKGSSDAHIPYRNSPLTKILRSSLGGNSRTAIVLCITPSASQLEQTFSTLRFGQNAKMIKNTIVANVKAGGSDQELRVILSEYERRLREMESDKNESSEKLRQIIENLMREKDELAQRLIKANHDKLQIKTADQQNVQPDDFSGQLQQNPDTDKDPDSDQQTSFYLWGIGMLHSCQFIDKVLTSMPNPGQLLDKKIYSSEYILKYPHQITENIAIEALRAEKQESLKLRDNLLETEEKLSQIQDSHHELEAKHLDLEDRYQALETENQHNKQVLDELRGQNSFLQQQLQQALSDAMKKEEQLNEQILKLQNECENQLKSFQELQKEKQLDQAQLQRLQSALEDQEKNLRIQSDNLHLELSKNETLQNRILEIEEAHRMLTENRYILTREDAAQMLEQRLEVTEMQLFKSIQRINIERGRREVRGAGTSLITSPIDKTLVGERQQRYHQSREKSMISNKKSPIQSGLSPLAPQDLQLLSLRSPFDYREGDENQPFPQTSKNNQHVVMLMTGENMKTSSLGCEEEVAEVSPYPQYEHGDSIDQMLDEGFAYLGSARQALASATRRTNHNEAVKINSPISSSEHSVSSVNRESLIRQNLLGSFNRQGKMYHHNHDSKTAGATPTRNPETMNNHSEGPHRYANNNTKTAPLQNLSIKAHEQNFKISKNPDQNSKFVEGQLVNPSVSTRSLNKFISNQATQPHQGDQHEVPQSQRSTVLREMFSLFNQKPEMAAQSHLIGNHHSKNPSSQIMHKKQLDTVRTNENENQIQRKVSKEEADMRIRNQEESYLLARPNTVNGNPGNLKLQKISNKTQQQLSSKITNSENHKTAQPEIETLIAQQTQTSLLNNPKVQRTSPQSLVDLSQKRNEVHKKTEVNIDFYNFAEEGPLLNNEFQQYQNVTNEKYSKLQNIDQLSNRFSQSTTNWDYVAESQLKSARNQLYSNTPVTQSKPHTTNATPTQSQKCQNSADMQRSFEQSLPFQNNKIEEQNFNQQLTLNNTNRSQQHSGKAKYLSNLNNQLKSRQEANKEAAVGTSTSPHTQRSTAPTSGLLSEDHRRQLEMLRELMKQNGNTSRLQQ